MRKKLSPVLYGSRRLGKRGEINGAREDHQGKRLHNTRKKAKKKPRQGKAWACLNEKGTVAGTSDWKKEEV